MVVGKLVFDRNLMGRLVKQRRRLEETGVTSLDFEESTKTFLARVVGEEEAVARSVSLMLELADGCGFSPGNHTMDN